MDDTDPCIVMGCSLGHIFDSDGDPICYRCGRVYEDVWDKEERDVCDDCGGTGYDDHAPDDGTEDFDVCKTCGGHG